MSTETTVQNLKINKLTKAQYDTITPSSTEAYELTDLSSILDGKQSITNLVTTLTTASTDTTYPSAKCVYDNLSNKANNSKVVKKDGGSSQQTVSLSSGSGATALGVKSRATSSYISFNNSSGWIGSYGVTSDKKPTFYNGTGYTLAYTSDIPTVPTIATSVTSSSTNTETVGAKLFYDSLNEKQATLVSGTNIKTVNNESLLGSGNITISGGGSTPSRNAGEVILSTIPLTDAGLHLLDGSLLQSGSYADFVTYIAGLVSSNPSLFTTESSWQTEVTNTGYCDKFVYDSTNTTVRLPKWGSQLITNLPSTAGVKGDGKTLGLTDGTNNFGSVAFINAGYNSIVPYGSEFGKNVSVGGSAPTVSTRPSNYSRIGVTTDVTKSGLVADLSDIPISNVYYYIVIANSTKTGIEVDIDDIATDLNGKMDVDMSNMNASSSAKKMVDNWGTPLWLSSGSSISMGFPTNPLSTTTTTYTCPSAGWIVLVASKSTAGYSLYLRINGLIAGQFVGYSAMGSTMYAPVGKNDVVSITTDNTSTTWTLNEQLFIPLRGEV